MNPFPDAAALAGFRDALLDWYDPEARPMPWKGSRDPYLIWLSEVILQQTRVEQGMPYFERFRARYPEVAALAAAPEDEVMKLWEGLGYYRRAQHMLRAARSMVEDHGGRVPESYAGLLALPGVGPYTAAAIASFAYDLPHAVLDGNVFRVLARFFGVDAPIDTGAGKRGFQELANAALDRSRPGRYNQAIMDFGATVCRPRAPRCSSCPLAARCAARRDGTQADLPVKRAARAKRTRHFHYLVLRCGPTRYVRKRGAGGIWPNLYEFPLIEEAEPGLTSEALRAHPQWKALLTDIPFRYLGRSPVFRQTLSHQIIRATFHEVELGQPLADPENGLLAVAAERLGDFAFPRIIDWYFKDNSLTLNI